MPAIQRLGDLNDVDAPIIGGCAATVFAGDKNVSVDGADVEVHGHIGVTTANGSSTVFAESRSVNFEGNSDSCVIHARVGGLGSVQVNS